MPLAMVLDDFRAETRATVDPWLVATQLGIPPDSSFLEDGLARTADILQAEAQELGFALRIVAGPRLEPDKLHFEVTRLLSWVRARAWPDGSEVQRLMSRPAADDRHPLAGYCLSTLFHWPNLFYDLPPTSAAPGVTTDQYRKLIQQFSTHVIAAHSSVAPLEYRRFCNQWFAQDVVPAENLFHPPRLHSRTAAACRVIRRITTPGYERLFCLLTSSGQPYHVALQAWDINAADDDEGNAVRILARFLHTVVPGWRKPNGLEARESGGNCGQWRQKVIRRSHGDGFVRVSDSDVVVSSITTDAGIEFETFAQRPPTEAELARQLAEQARKARGGTDETEDGDEEAEVSLSEQQSAADDAARLLDGHQWLPVAERIDGIGIEALRFPDDARDGSTDPLGLATGATVKWARDHRRRFQLLHRLKVDQVAATECKRIFTAIRAESVDADGAVLMALHASLALGVPFEKACRLRIYDQEGAVWQQDEQLRYVAASRCWWIRAPAPAFADEPLTRAERNHRDIVCLPDATDFHTLAVHHLAAGARIPILRLTKPREDKAEKWLKDATPGREVRLKQLPTVMFELLLAASRGDIGVPALLTRRDHAQSPSVAHYASYDQAALQRVYRKACHALGVTSAIDPPASVDTTSPVGHGAKRVPTIAAVQGLVAHMIERLEQTRGLERHNHFTAYTWVGCTLGIGMRPLSSVHLHDLANGIGDRPVVSFIDKARSDYHRRLAVVPAVLSEQLRRYVHYVIDQQRTLPMTVGSFFFIDQTMRATEAFRPSHFERLYGHVFDLEPYALRRFLRTELARQPNVSGEVLDAFMGHWNDGTSPHDPLSTFPFRLLNPFVRNHVTTLLKTVGYSARWFDHYRQ